MKKDIEEFYQFPLPSIGTISQDKTKYSKGRYGVFYCNISQGLNVYTRAFKEAFESLLLFDHLREYRQKME